MSNQKRETIFQVFYFLFYIMIALSILFSQPFGNPPDEWNRYLIPQYIARYGTLPNGFEESIRIPAYGFSYAFQPILPYMLQGYTMRLVQLFTGDFAVIFYSARLVNFFLGLFMAYFVLRLSGELFENRHLKYTFCLLVTFLPQSIFLHTYVNTDSCCMLSIAVILYSLMHCLKRDFPVKYCILLAFGIILCALSYYNAYGYILSCIFLFVAFYWKGAPSGSSKSLPTLDYKPFFKKGILIASIVLIGIGWWFIRSYILYDGDFLGLRTRDLCSILYGNENMHPDVRITYRSMGFTIPSMLLKSDFLIVSINSFICTYGPMAMLTSMLVYKFYKLLFAGGIVGLLFPEKDGKGGVRFENRPVLSVFFHFNLWLCILIPLVLSVIYSYGTDYQPQGRYLMPALLPLCYYCVRGIEKLCAFVSGCIKEKAIRLSRRENLIAVSCAAVSLGILASSLLTTYVYALPYFASVK